MVVIHSGDVILDHYPLSNPLPSKDYFCRYSRSEAKNESSCATISRCTPSVSARASQTHICWFIGPYLSTFVIRECDIFSMSCKITSTTACYFNAAPLFRFKANLSISHRKSLLCISTEKTKETGAQSAKCITAANVSVFDVTRQRRKQRRCDLLWLNKLQRMTMN